MIRLDPLDWASLCAHGNSPLFSPRSISLPNSPAVRHMVWTCIKDGACGPPRIGGVVGPCHNLVAQNVGAVCHTVWWAYVWGSSRLRPRGPASLVDPIEICPPIPNLVAVGQTVWVYGKEFKNSVGSSAPPLGDGAGSVESFLPFWCVTVTNLIAPGQAVWETIGRPYVINLTHGAFHMGRQELKICF